MDALLDISTLLPPPPCANEVVRKVPRPRGPTRASIPAKNSLLIDVNDIEEDVPVENNFNSLVATVSLSHSRKLNVLLRETMLTSGTRMFSVPIFLDKNGKRYPKKTRIKCWHCRHKFDSRPIGCPFRYKRRGNAYDCEGIFCSFSCSKAYGISANRELFRFSGTYLLKMRKAMTGENFSTPLIAAPHWCRLADYGGDLSIQEFRKIGASKLIQVIPESLKLFAFGFNVFEMKRKTSSRSAHETLQRKAPNFEHRKIAYGAAKRNKRRKLTNTIGRCVQNGLIRTNTKKIANSRTIGKFMKKTSQKKTKRVIKL